MIQNAKKKLIDVNGTMLLGLSGGPDSMCLFALLLELKKPFHVAHIDHGLRESSRKEREALQKLAKENGVPFHYKRLESASHSKNNLEDVLREERISFFKGVMEEEGVDVLLLGHQKDERAETVIKRFFEGSGLFNLGGIKEVSCYRGIKVRRPLLDVTKKQVLGYLLKNNIPYFIDPTNIGDFNLRAKMRASLIPSLEEQFGKSIVSSVCDIADQAHEMGAYIDTKVELLRKKEIKGVFGSFFSYGSIGEDFILTQLILKCLKERKVLYSREDRKHIANFIERKAVEKCLEFHSYTLYFEEAGIFLVEKSKFRPIQGVLEKDVPWESVWQEGIDLKEVRKALEVPNLKKQVLSEWFRKNKVPVFLRKVFPIPLTIIAGKTKIGLA